jgi:hypothetical protein
MRIKNISGLHWERVIFPGERLMFEAVSEAQLEIWFNESLNVVIPCNQLSVIEPTAVHRLIQS